MKAAYTKPTHIAAYPWRFKLVAGFLIIAFMLIIWRIVGLQIIEHDFLSAEGNARTLRTEPVKAYRGMILDRNGEPLAVSTPVVSIWVNPKEITDLKLLVSALAKPLNIPAHILTKRLQKTKGREFVYLKRRMPPSLAENILDLKIAGVHSHKEYRRYYPAGEVAAHIVGFTDIDDSGQEGMELAYDDWLQGRAGRKLVMKNRYGRVVKDIKSLQEEKPGKNLYLSIDLRLQYLAYRELLAAVKEHHAKSGMLVLLDAETGEVLAMVNQPSYNPNKRDSIKYDHLRNRVLTDVFEPGSTVKPFTVAAALEAGKYSPTSIINTSPGYMRIGRNTIRDHRNYGEINLETLLIKSSNVGAGKLALALGHNTVLSMFSKAQFGVVTGSGFPGESAGTLPYHNKWKDIELVTLSYGYGISVTTLQLAQAYTIFAGNGKLKPASLLKQTEPVAGAPVISTKTATAILAMLEGVVQQGTGTKAQVSSYKVAGKTGTVHKATGGVYKSDKYIALFAGLAPAINPKIIAVVVIDEPSGKEYYGGEVAAPVFSRVAAGALRLLNIPPNNVKPKIVDSTDNTEGDSV